MVAVVEAIAAENNRKAVALRDEGKLDEAQKLLLKNAGYLDNEATRYNAPKLKKYSQENEDDAKNLDGNKWTIRRKAMRSSQHKIDTQQAY
jgi:Ca-activated chloride channel homolog